MGIAQKLKPAAVDFIGPGFSCDHHLPAAVVSVLSVEITRQHAEILNGIEIRDERRGHAKIFFHVISIEDKAIAGFTLAANGEIAGIEITGRGSAGAARHDYGVGLPGTDGNHARLKGK